ncbi:hypothetical protein SEA_HAGER_16 [Microbacterium phage Hager]|nr:hypothetical protein SEA_HAGER_16 [Microbacterium phage Hager]
MGANRRALTLAPVRDNSIFTIYGMRDGYFKSHSAHHYRRRFSSGLYTGPVRK